MVDDLWACAVAAAVEIRVGAAHRNFLSRTYDLSVWVCEGCLHRRESFLRRIVRSMNRLKELSVQYELVPPFKLGFPGADPSPFLPTCQKIT